MSPDCSDGGTGERQGKGEGGEGEREEEGEGGREGKRRGEG